MAKPEWGVKRTCAACTARFYDFSKKPILCPSCGAEFLPDAALKPRRARAAPAAAPKPEAAAPAVEEEAKTETPKDGADMAEDELVAIEDGNSETTNDADDDSVIQDTSDLGGEDDGGLGEAGVKITEGGDT